MLTLNVIHTDCEINGLPMFFENSCIAFLKKILSKFIQIMFSVFGIISMIKCSDAQRIKLFFRKVHDEIVMY